jgi:hypothetical protein
VPLTIGNPPQSAYTLVADAVRRLAGAGGAARALAAADPSKLSVALPHKVYTVDADAIAQGGKLDRARLVEWRFLILDGQSPVAAVELSCDEQGRNLKFAGLNTGPFVAGTRDAVLHAEGLDAVKNGSYELRALRLPSVYVMALWLKDLVGENDLLLPFGPSSHAVAPAEHRAGTLAGVANPTPAPHLAPDDFFGALRDSARDAVSFDSSPRQTRPTP